MAKNYSRIDIDPAAQQWVDFFDDAGITNGVGEALDARGLPPPRPDVSPARRPRWVDAWWYLSLGFLAGMLVGWWCLRGD